MKAGLEKDKSALLIIIGALTNGKKVFLACESGYRESKESWGVVLRNLRDRGLKLGRMTIADGHLLLITEETLGTYSDNKRSGVTVQLGETDDRCYKTVQEDT